MRLLSWILVNVLALGLAVWLFDGIRVTGATTTDRALTLVAVGVIFGVVTALVKPLLKLLTCPFILLTLGLLLLVINALMLLLTEKIATWAGLGFQVDGFWTALLGSIVISLASALLAAVLRDDKER